MRPGCVCVVHSIGRVAEIGNSHCIMNGICEYRFVYDEKTCDDFHDCDSFTPDLCSRCQFAMQCNGLIFMISIDSFMDGNSFVMQYKEESLPYSKWISSLNPSVMKGKEDMEMQNLNYFLFVLFIRSDNSVQCSTNTFSNTKSYSEQILVIFCFAYFFIYVYYIYVMSAVVVCCCPFHMPVYQ